MSSSGSNWTVRPPPTGFTPEQQQMLKDSVYGSATLALLGAVLIVTMILQLPYKKRLTRHWILLNLGLCNGVGAIGYLIGSNSFTRPLLCSVQGFLVHYGLGYSIAIASLATDVLLRLGFYWSDVRAAPLLKYYILAIWGIPTILATIPAFMGVVVPSGPWCAITAKRPDLRIIFFFGPLWCIMIYVTMVTVMLVCKMVHTWRGVGESIDGARRGVLLQVVSWDLVFVLVWSVPTANRIYTSLYPDKQIFWLNLLQGIVIGAHGFIDFLVYMVPSLVVRWRERQRLKRWYSSGSGRDKHTALASACVDSHDPSHPKKPVPPPGCKLISSSISTLPCRASQKILGHDSPGYTHIPVGTAESVQNICSESLTFTSTSCNIVLAGQEQAARNSVGGKAENSHFGIAPRTRADDSC